VYRIFVRPDAVVLMRGSPLTIISVPRAGGDPTETSLTYSRTVSGFQVLTADDQSAFGYATFGDSTTGVQSVVVRIDFDTGLVTELTDPTERPTATHAMTFGGAMAVRAGVLFYNLSTCDGSGAAQICTTDLYARRAH
jgi:hypothetical protein